MYKTPGRRKDENSGGDKEEVGRGVINLPVGGSFATDVRYSQQSGEVRLIEHERSVSSGGGKEKKRLKGGERNMPPDGSGAEKIGDRHSVSDRSTSDNNMGAEHLGISPVVLPVAARSGNSARFPFLRGFFCFHFFLLRFLSDFPSKDPASPLSLALASGGLRVAFRGLLFLGCLFPLTLRDSRESTGMRPPPLVMTEQTNLEGCLGFYLAIDRLGVFFLVGPRSRHCTAVR
ncbi:hypothetical protein B0T19DRAFT_181445 [Cercophora scortea]|uniref:Uncharacterized protein n=1 Tax=Cercophora scortea TaxID=314031 RepID=A0AAE0IN78_9PEZI|nr:hypothetical protein B0T19DRAFT_181445 [Cercophora scortea]